MFDCEYCGPRCSGGGGAQVFLTRAMGTVHRSSSRVIPREKLPALVRQREHSLAAANGSNDYRPVGALSRPTPATLIREYCTARDLPANRVITTLEWSATGKTAAFTTRANGEWLPPERAVRRRPPPKLAPISSSGASSRMVTITSSGTQR